MLRITFVVLALSVADFSIASAQSPSDACLRAADRNDRIAACTKLIQDSKNQKTLVGAYNTRGLALCALDRCSEAVPDFERVIHLNPNIAGFFDNYARALREAGRFDDALRAEDHAIRMAPQYAFLYYGKAKALEAKGDPAAAFEETGNALRAEPNNAGVWEYRGKLLGELARYPAAYQSLERALSIEPTRSHVLITRSEVEEMQGNIGSALADLRNYPESGDSYAEAQKKIRELTENAPVQTKAAMSTSASLPEGRDASQATNAATAQEGRAQGRENADLDSAGCWSITDNQRRLECYDRRGGQAQAAEGRSQAPEKVIAYNTPSSFGASDLAKMHETYEKNQARFFRDFGGKTFQAMLPLASVRRNIIDTKRFDVAFGESSGEVSCAIEDQKTIDLVTDMNKGDQVRVNGSIEDHTFGTVELKDCSISKP